MFRAHSTSYLTGGLQSQCFTIPYATAYCPPMTGYRLEALYHYSHLFQVLHHKLKPFIKQPYAKAEGFNVWFFFIHFPFRQIGFPRTVIRTDASCEHANSISILLPAAVITSVTGEESPHIPCLCILPGMDGIYAAKRIKPRPFFKCFLFWLCRLAFCNTNRKKAHQFILIRHV